MKKLISLLLISCLFATLLSGCLGYRFANALLSGNPDESTSSATPPHYASPTDAPTEETEPLVPEYILDWLFNDLLFYDAGLAEAPASGDGTWHITGNFGVYALTVTTDKGVVTSVVVEGFASEVSSSVVLEKCALYENGTVIMTMEDYLAKGYKERCQEINYEDLARNPDRHKNEDFTFTGEVIQVYEDGQKTILRVNVTPYSIGDSTYYEDTIYVTVDIEEGTDRILEDDIITIWGSCSGLVSYQSIFGQQISIPGISAYYYEIVS